MNNYYIYFYVRNDYRPYYVGKGSKYRAWEKHKNVSTPKNKSKIIIVQDNLSELQSFILERYYIRWFGRKCDNTGILLNKTEGGEGTSGYSHSITSIEKSRSKRIGQKRSKETCDAISKSLTGRKQEKTQIEKRANSHRGLKRSEKARENMKTAQNRPEVLIKNSLSNKIAQNRPEVKNRKSKTYIITTPNDETLIIKNLNNFCKENDLNQGNMWSVCNNKYGKDNYKGFKIKEYA